MSSQPNNLAPWRSPIARALHRNRAVAYSRYLQLATIDTDGTPANRTVVFRGFLEGANQMMFISDRRSDKIAQITCYPTAAACWYFTKTREQFRLTGPIVAITADSPEPSAQNARTRLWQNISDSARVQFAWPQPKAPRSDRSEAFSPPPPDPQTPPDSFCLLMLDPQKVDHLCLRGDPQNRTLYQRLANNPDADTTPGQSPIWQITAVNP